MNTRTSQPRREAGKTSRRRRIVEAASMLLRETSFESVAMVDIAARAEVSPATLYNLFQTKLAIFGAVFDEDLVRFTRKVAAADAAGPIDRIFVAIDLAASLYRRNGKFYRAMAHVGDTPLHRAISEPRRRFWQDRVSEAIAAGELRPHADARLIGGLLMQIMRGLFVDWAVGAISVDRLAKETAYGFALVLSAHAAKGSAPQLADKINNLERTLAVRGDARQD